MSFIPFTDEEKERALNIDLESFLIAHGETLLSSGHEKRLSSDHSITIRGCEWYDHASGVGGKAVSFVQKHYSLSYPEAMQMLLGIDHNTIYPSANPKAPIVVKPFELPPKNKDMRRVFAYLSQNRKIDSDIISWFAKKGTLYEDAAHHNAVFVGTDLDGKPLHAHKRSVCSFGKSFKMNVEGSNPHYSFNHVGTNGSLYVFEAPIDLLSYICMHKDNWEASSYVACCGTSSLPVQRMTEQIVGIKEIHLCLDNDEAGQTAEERMDEQFSSKFDIRIEVPVNKDWNDDLVFLQHQESEAMSSCQAFGY